MNPFRKIKEPRVLLPLIMLITAARFCGFAILSRISANPAFCVSCHNMQPEYDSYVQGDLLARKHADAGVTCHDCHEPTMLQQMNEGWLFVTGNYENPMPPVIQMRSVSPVTRSVRSRRQRHTTARRTRTIPYISQAMKIRRTAWTATACTIRSLRRSVQSAMMSAGSSTQAGKSNAWIVTFLILSATK